jgi:hypothetical protein
MTYKPSQESLNRTAARAVSDAADGKFSPPKGDGFVDAIFSPVTLITGEPSSKEIAAAHSQTYRDTWNSSPKK